MVFRDSFSFDVAFDGNTNPTAGAAFGNLSGTGNPADWLDLNDFGFGACYWVDLTFTGNDGCGGGGPGPGDNDECAGAIELDVPPGGSDSESGSTVGASIDDVECVTPTTAPGVWYKVTGNGNVMTATTCPPGDANYDTKISVFCGSCPAPAGPSDCCFSNGTPGCDDPGCEAIVCAPAPARPSPSAALSVRLAAS
jgi:hypothetical protein